MLANWWRSARPKGKGRRQSRPAKRSHGHTFRPQVVRLEDRIVFSVNMGSNFDGIAFINDPRFEPPDTSGAVGPNHFVETVNTTIAIYNKSNGQQLSLQRLETFFNSGNIFMFDPVTTYDSITNRFIVAALEQD